MKAPDSGRLFQEDLKDRPEWMLVACILINKTHWRQVQPVLARLMEQTGGDVAKLESLPGLENSIKSLGFSGRRSDHLRKFGAAWVRKTPKTAKDVLKMPGCGPYAAQSWEIFCEGPVPEGKGRLG